MDKSEILSHIDHTALKPYVTKEEILGLCSEALDYHTASVCIPPAYVALARGKFSALNIGTVVGFPLGYSTTSSKVFEAREAVGNGAGEIDMVIHIGAVKNGEYDKIIAEIAAVKEACGYKILKVIVETCYLTPSEKAFLCDSVSKAKADYIKTSTGFGSAGAVVDDILLFKEHLDPKIKIKAAGGMNSVEDMKKFLQAGADRLGTSKGVTLLK